MSELREAGTVRIDPEAIYTADHLKKQLGRSLFAAVSAKVYCPVQGYYHGKAVRIAIDEVLLRKP